MGASDRDADGGGVQGQLAHISGPAGPDRSGTRPLAVRLCTAKSVVCAAAACSCPAWSTRHGPPRRRYTHRAASRRPCASTARDVRGDLRAYNPPRPACTRLGRARLAPRGGKSGRRSNLANEQKKPANPTPRCAVTRQIRPTPTLRQLVAAGAPAPLNPRACTPRCREPLDSSLACRWLRTNRQ